MRDDAPVTRILLALRPELVWEGIEAANDLREFMSWATGRAAASES